MRRLVVIFVLLGLACVAMGQRKAIKFPKEKKNSVVKVKADPKLEAAKGDVRIGPDGRPLLFGPNIELCKNRTSHGKLGKHHYFLSWREPWHKFEDWDWFNGRNFCRERCMDLISFDDPVEFKMFEEVMQQDNISSIYTSGRKCNFKGKGCEQEQFQPINVNGWFWAGAGNARIPPTNKRNRGTFWSHTGELKKPQPDNYEGLKAGKLEKVSDPVGLTLEDLQEWHDEACLAVLNNKYNDKIRWHDVACHFRSKIVCEDSEQLIKRALSENPGHTIPEPVAQTD
ncbi:hypothetical protein TCAL_02922 [Tigriopus californicus]|uniref:C-type lectin domain-containing protein n=1 Tax=Tigriopus californicus TaxID=6832 RepID=A0A553NQQ9_TIGCA|nr:uncharacterized protein LOC131879469 [Tigriopus californicus]TRY67782.1 hypothetical protein TCAL_02922 [Tigriopus californicus]